MSPQSPLRPCGQPGCPALVQRGKCERHGGTTVAVEPRGWSTPSSASHLRLRGRAWMVIRRDVLATEARCYVCQGGGGSDDYVDHVVPLSEGGTDDRSNLRRICRACHVRKTGREARGGRGR